MDEERLFAGFVEEDIPPMAEEEEEEGWRDITWPDMERDIDEDRNDDMNARDGEDEVESGGEKYAAPVTEQPDIPRGQGGSRECLLRFARTFPGVKAENIPQEIWDGFRKGGDLVGLYAAHENRQLRQRLNALEKNGRNKQRSTGSRKSAGGQKRRMTVQELWDAED